MWEANLLGGGVSRPEPAAAVVPSSSRAEAPSYRKCYTACAKLIKNYREHIMNRSHLLRQGRQSIPNAHYLVTATTRHRQQVFTNFHTACCASRHFYHPRVSELATTLAFVVMPDHIHWLLQLNGDLSEAVRRYKAYVSLNIDRRLWQDGFHDRMIKDEASLKAAARYIVANPLRANLLEDIGKYSYWDAIWL